MPSNPKVTPAERLMDELEKAPPLEQLAFLLNVQDAAAELRTVALQALQRDGWSRYAIAGELGISHQAVYRWETAGRAKKAKR